MNRSLIRIILTGICNYAFCADGKPKGARLASYLPFALVVALLTVAAGCTMAPLPNFHRVSDSVYRGGRPTEEGIKVLSRMGIKTIVDLESGFFVKETDDVMREEDWARQAGIKFIKIPMHPFFAPDEAQVSSAYEALSNKDNQPVFVHCVRGSDRTGTVIASYRIFSEGWTFEKSFSEMKELGHRDIILFWWRDVIAKIFSRGKSKVEAAPRKTE